MKSGEAKSGKPIMSQAITFNLPDELAERVRQLADQSRQSLEEVLVALVERATDDPPLEILSDEQVLALADLQLPPDQDAEFSKLLAQNAEGQLDDRGRVRLEQLMAMYRHGMVRKAHALQVAVERGLRPPLNQS